MILLFWNYRFSAPPPNKKCLGPKIGGHSKSWPSCNLVLVVSANCISALSRILTSLTELLHIQTIQDILLYLLNPCPNALPSFKDPHPIDFSVVLGKVRHQPEVTEDHCRSALIMSFWTAGRFTAVHNNSLSSAE